MTHTMATMDRRSTDPMEEDEEQYVDAEEKGFLADDSREPTPPKCRLALTSRFWLSAGVNTTATAAIVSLYH